MAKTRNELKSLNDAELTGLWVDRIGCESKDCDADGCNQCETVSRQSKITQILTIG